MPSRVERILWDYHGELQNLLNAFAGFLHPLDDPDTDRLADLQRHVRRFVIADLALRRHARRHGVELPTPATPAPIVELVKAVRRLQPRNIDTEALESLAEVFGATKGHKLPRPNSLEVAAKPTNHPVEAQ